MMSMKALSPIQQSVVTTMAFVAVGLLFRFGYGAIDPEARSWGVVAIAPLFGLARYVHATDRSPFPPELMIAIGYIGILVCARGFVRDGLPGPLGEWILWGLIVAVPLGLMVWGIIMVRRRDAAPQSTGSASAE
jgi:hypothetical protein